MLRCTEVLQKLVGLGQKLPKRDVRYHVPCGASALPIGYKAHVPLNSSENTSDARSLRSEISQIIDFAVSYAETLARDGTATATILSVLLRYYRVCFDPWLFGHTG